MDKIWEDISKATNQVYEDKKQGEYTKAWIIIGISAGVIAIGFYAIYRFSD